MLKKYISACLILTGIYQSANAQDVVPVRSDIRFEISADSLSRNKNPQDITLSITSNTADEIEVYKIYLNNTDVLWTVVSAELNGQPLWLIMDNSKSERSEILVWHHDQEENNLIFYPPSGSTNYSLNLNVRLNLLRSNTLEKKSAGTVILEAQSKEIVSRCSATGRGDRVFFK